eukprot:3476306-Pleurochrysis_carterae.AAC.1
MVNVALITAALVLGVQHALHDSGARGAIHSRMAAVCAASVLVACACAAAFAVAPTAGVVSR